MAKMGEGEYYYYLPHRSNKSGFFICKRDAPHPNYTVIVEYASQENASLIVDALNDQVKMKNYFELQADLRRETWELKHGKT